MCGIIRQSKYPPLMICTPKVRQTFGGAFFDERNKEKEEKILARIQNNCYNGYEA